MVRHFGIAIDAACTECDQMATGADQLCDGCRADLNPPRVCLDCNRTIDTGSEDDCHCPPDPADER